MTTHHPGIARRFRFALLATAAAAGAGAGCGPAVSDGDSQVWGRVTVRGTPLTEGTVVLSPLADRDVTWGAGQLDQDGRFHVTSSRSDVPLLPGRYNVYIRPPMRVGQAEGQLIAPPDYPVSAKYLDQVSPVIQIEIKDEPTRLDLKLDD